jgi:hypothetical protein
MILLRIVYKIFFPIFSYPIYLYLKFKKILIVGGMITSAGHSFQESHFFYLKKKFFLLPKKYKFLFIANKNHITEFVKKFLNFYNYSFLNNYLDYFKNDLCRTYPDIVYYNNLSHYTQAKKISWIKGFQTQSSYYALFNKEDSFFNNFKFSKEIIDRFIKKKYIVIQIKNEIVNATAKETDPLTYIPLLKFIKKEYAIIFIGREKMPEIFNDYIDWNYANSSYACYSNDVNLISRSEFSIIFGSGLANIPMILGKYYLYLGFWHLIAPSASKYCVFIPTLLKFKNNNKILDLKKNYIFFRNSKMQCFKSKKLIPINPNSKDILEGFKELVSLKKNYTKMHFLQKKYNNFYKNQPINFSNARVSLNFIKKYKNYLF